MDRVTEMESLFSLLSDHEKKVIPPVDKPSDEGAVEVSNIPASTVATSIGTAFREQEAVNPCRQQEDCDRSSSNSL